jgi:hypothetical protein
MDNEPGPNDLGQRGDLVAVRTPNKTPVWYHDGMGWQPDTGRRAGLAKGQHGLVRFPVGEDKSWNGFVLNGYGEQVEWKSYSAAIRQWREQSQKANDTDGSSGLSDGHSGMSRPSKKSRKKKKKEGHAVSGTPMDGGSGSESAESQLPKKKMGKGNRAAGTLSTPSPPPTPKQHNLWLGPLIDRMKHNFEYAPKILDEALKPLMRLYDLNQELEVVPSLDSHESGILTSVHPTKGQLMVDLLLSNPPPRVVESFRTNTTCDVTDLMGNLVDDFPKSRRNIKGVFGCPNVFPHVQGTGAVKWGLPASMTASASITEVKGGFTDNASTLTERGYYTPPHWDFYAIAQIVNHIFGQKLWLTWPATEHNLKIAADYLPFETESQSFDIADALDLLEGVKVRIMEETSRWFILEPFMIHAVISISNCGHRNKLFVDYDHFGDWDRAYNCFVDARARDVYREGNTEGRVSNAIYELEESLKGHRHWETLLLENPFHPSCEHVGMRLAEIERKVLEEIRKLREVLPVESQDPSPSEDPSENDELENISGKKSGKRAFGDDSSGSEYGQQSKKKKKPKPKKAVDRKPRT